MEEIKVGEYIRTKEGDIFKITNYGLGETAKGDVLLVELNKDFEMEKCNLDIVKHSKNIIDLIEVGDYVNGYEVRGKTEAQGGYVQVDYYMYSEQLGEGRFLTFNKKDIKSIVTKEQFKKVEYKF